MMLLIGIKINFTKNPTNPITTNPIAVRVATFVNSTKYKTRIFKIPNFFYCDNPMINKKINTFLIGFVAAFDESDAIFSEFSERIDDGIYGVHCCWREIGDRETLDRFIWDFFFFLFERAKNTRERERESLMTIALQTVQTPFYFSTSVTRKRRLFLVKAGRQILFDLIFIYLFILLDWKVFHK